MFLIQTRRDSVPKNIINEAFNSTNNAQDWGNYSQHEDIEGAKRNCESMIKLGQIKAKNIRIVEVVCTFQSEIIVSSKE